MVFNTLFLITSIKVTLMTFIYFIFMAYLTIVLKKRFLFFFSKIIVEKMFIIFL